MKKQPKTSKKGFTLTEILVVVLIIAVLSAVVYPLYTKSITKSRAVEAINLLEMVRNKQIEKYARDNQYYDEFSAMGQLTSNISNEELKNGGQQLKVKDYTLSLNTATNCMNARYQKGSSSFTFSTSYEAAGLGCTGSICSSFGDIIGDAKSVCNCGSKSCSGGYSLNEETCSCECLMGCDQGGKCYDAYGGGLTRPCSSGCGTETSTASCGGSVWSGSCWSPSKAKESQACGKGGTQTRTCKSSCNAEDCTSWGPCSGQSCDTASKPATSQGCGKCGTQTRACDSVTGKWKDWGTCESEKDCVKGTTQACGGGNGLQTCSDTCGWGACACNEGYVLEGDTCVAQVKNCDDAEKPDLTRPCAKCGTQTGTMECDTTTGEWGPITWSDTCEDQGECEADSTQRCGAGNTGFQTCNSSCQWDECKGSKTACMACPPGTTRDYKVMYQEDGNCCKVECNAKPVYWSTGTPQSGGLIQTSCGPQAPGTESFCYKDDFISSYKCYDSNNKPCTGCTLPKCADNSYFLANKPYCCGTALGNRSECCRVVSMTFPSYCNRLPPGQECSMSVAILTCKNSLGNACQCPSNGYELSGDWENQDTDAGKGDSIDIGSIGQLEDLEIVDWP